QVIWRGRLVNRIVGSWKAIAPGLPGMTSTDPAGVVGKVTIKHDSLGREAIQRRRINPLIAVTPYEAEMEPVGRDDNRFHTSRLYGVPEWVSSRSRGGTVA